MREFVYYSPTAVTSGNFIKEDLKKSGRMDIVCNFIISSFFISNKMRPDVKLHLIFDGPPKNPKHLVFESNEKMPISKKDVAGLIKRMLYKSKEEEGLIEIYPGAFIEKKSFEKLLKELDKEGKNVFILDKKGKDIRKINFNKNEVFVFGDQEGFPKHMKRLLKKIDKISVGPQVLFASQTATIVHNELDRILLKY